MPTIKAHKAIKTLLLCTLLLTQNPSNQCCIKH